MLAGNAGVTAENPQTGGRFTYRIRRGGQAAPTPIWFVSVLTGPDNTRDYDYIGTIFGRDGMPFRLTRGSLLGADAPSVAAFAWLWERVAVGRSVAPALLHHEGRCGRCGRALTVPTSIEAGFGPECSARAR